MEDEATRGCDLRNEIVATDRRGSGLIYLRRECRTFPHHEPFGAYQSTVAERARAAYNRRMTSIRRRWLLMELAWTSANGNASPIDVVTVHPIFNRPFICSEHWDGNLKSLGDALGSDRVIEQMVDEEGRLWMRPYRGNGQQNEDWFGWDGDVLAPCTCEVARVAQNKVVNTPGHLGKPPAAAITFRRSDGVHIVLAHVATVSVAPGTQVTAGDWVAKVGNNGMSRHPHIHIGAWKGDQPLQIRFDLAAMGNLLR